MQKKLLVIFVLFFDLAWLLPYYIWHYFCFIKSLQMVGKHNL